MSKPSITLAIRACLGVALRRSLVGGAWSLVVVTAVVASLGNAFAGEGPNTELPFTDNFEDYPTNTPLIDGINGWYGSSISIVVVSNNAIAPAGSTNLAVIPEDCMLSNRFEGIDPTNVWIQMNMRPNLYDGTNTPPVNTNAAWIFYLNSNGNFVVHNGPTDNPSNSPNWVVITNGGVGTGAPTWVSIGIYEDFTKTNWDLYANGVLVTNAIGFVNKNLTSFAGFDIYNGSQTTCLDNIHVSAPGTVMVSPTNLRCLAMRGGVASNLTFVITAQNGVWNFTNKSSAAWLNASPTTGVVDADAGGAYITVRCDNNLVGSYSYTGIVSVSATNVDGLPRTNTVTVTLDVMELQVTPTNLAMTNGFMYSNTLAISSQTFSVWNAGMGTFNYTAQPQGDATNWLRLIVTNSEAGSNTITVVYSNGLTPRAYAGEVWVVTTNGGGATSPVSVAVTVVARPVLELSTLVLTQRVTKGANPTPQNFTIRNGSVPPVVKMRYTLAPSNGSHNLISTLSAVVGDSTGETNSVTVNYMDISGMEMGVYTARVHVAAWDAGNTYSPTGTVQSSTTVVVQVTVAALDAPSGITASDGTYTNKVAVSWNFVTDAVKYKVYRYKTFDSTSAEPIGETVGTDTSFDDLTGTAGVQYYYWVSSVNGYMGEGAMSTNRETGYRGLAAPGGIFATDGTYTNKVQVTWPEVDGATGYQLYRRNADIAGDALAPIYFTSGGVYDDMSVEPGIHYEYRVGATNGMFGSVLSIAAIGYAFGAPGELSASDGTYVGKVRVTWTGMESASEYEVWRGTQAILPPGGGAVKMATVVSPMFDDTSVSAGVLYYYWVRGYSLAAGIGGWSEMDRGYGAVAGLDLWVNDLVVLPVQVGVESSPVIVSFRMGNGGGTNMAGANGTVGMEFFASTNQVFGAGGEILIGKVVKQVTLGIGQDMVMKVDGGQVVLPGVENDYYVFVRVLPEYPSLLVDTNPDDNVAKRNGSVRVRSSGGLNYQTFNDYDGDGMSDLGVYRGMAWSIRSVDGRLLVSQYNVFGGAGQPVLGDMDGDRRADPMVFDSRSGIWQVVFSGSGYRWASGVFGDGGGYRALMADYEGVGHGDASVFHERGGRWYVLKKNGGLIEWNWGEAGYEPVTGDFDGNGCWDLAVYQESAGLWYIRSKLSEPWFVSGVFGGPGYRPVPGDYDGDGRWDAALYAREPGRWYILSLDGRILGWDIGGVGPGFEPVMGDYDGDGKWDLGMYQESSGLWYIASLDGRILAWAIPWGGPGYRPIGN